MRNSVFAILIGFLLLMVTLIFATSTLLVSGLTAYVPASQGEVQVQRGGRGAWRPLAVQDGVARVKVGDQVRTGPASWAVLQWADGTRVQVDANSRLTVRKYQFDTDTQRQQSLFKLDLGRLWVRVTHALNAGSRFEVQTPTAVAGVRGTIFTVEATADGTSVQVLDGEVALTAAGKETAVAAGAAAATANKAVRVRPLSAAEAAAWGEHAIVLPGVRFRRFLPGLVKDGTYPLRGVAEPGAKVMIDGTAVAVGPDGSFSHRVAVKPGVNHYRVSVTDAAGHERTVVHRIEIGR